MPTTLDDHPSLPLPPARHQQVRALLVREARPAPARRWVLPVAVAASVALVVAGTQLLGGDDGTAPATAPPPAVDCAAAQPPLTPADVPDAWRLLPADATADSVSHVEVMRSVTACSTAETPLEVLAQVEADGTVVAALTLWTDAPRPGGWEGSTSPLRVRGTDGVVQAADDPSSTWLWWSEGGEDRSVTAWGVDRSEVLALVEALTDAGATVPESAYPAGTARLDGWRQAAVPEPVEPVWSVRYEGRPATTIQVLRQQWSWQPDLSKARGVVRLVDVGGRPGVLVDSGNTWVHWTLEDGAQASVLTDTSAPDPGVVLEVARSLEPVAADDPRLAADPAPTP